MIKLLLYFHTFRQTKTRQKPAHKIKNVKFIKDPYNIYGCVKLFYTSIFIRLNKTNVRYELIFTCEVSALV